MTEFCCDKMKSGLDWGDDCKGDRTMMLEDNDIYMACADCQTHGGNPINFCPWCGKKVE